MNDGERLYSGIFLADSHRIKRISFLRNQSSDKLITFSILERPEARLDPRSSILARIENRGSSLDTRLAKDCQLTVYPLLARLYTTEQVLFASASHVTNPRAHHIDFQDECNLQ